MAPLLASAARRGMSVFTQRVNPVTGAVDWEMQPESYDYQQEVARSAYADMLHDTERVSVDWRRTGGLVEVEVEVERWWRTGQYSGSGTEERTEEQVVNKWIILTH